MCPGALSPNKGERRPPREPSGCVRVVTLDNQRLIVQSIFAVHESRECFVSARTWGQFLTGKFQDAIEQALSERLTPC
jgi:hypothetical protein